MKKFNLFFLIYTSLFFGILTTQAQSLSVAATIISNVSCYGGSNGSIFAYTSGGTTPYTYLWSPGSQTNQTASNLSASTYTVQVTDLLGNTSSSSATISQPAALTISASSKYGTVCAGMPDSLFSEATGGVTPYKYTWSGAYGDISCPNCPNTSAFPYGQAYLLTAVFDYNGCTATASVNITVHTPPLVSIAGPINPIAPGRSDTLVASVVGSATYLWSNSSTTSSIIVSPSVSTTYSVTVTNMFGCYDTAHYTIDTNSVGNGASSSSPVRIVPSASVTTGSYSTLDSVVWFSFIPTDSNNQIIATSAYLGLPVPHIHRLTLYDNSLNMLVDEPMPDITGANQIRIDISHLHPGSSYLVRASRCPAHANMAGCNPSGAGECNASQRWDFQMCFRTVPVFVPQDSGAEAPSASQLYYEDRGQIEDLNGIPRFDIKAYTNFACPAIYSSDSAVSFVYSNNDSIQRVDMVLTGTGVQPSQPVFKMEEDSGAGYLNYIKGFVPNGVPKIEGYSRLVYKNIYSNVDMHVYSNNEGTKLYFVCNPTVGTTSGGNPANIELQFKGATSVSATGGSLKVVTELGTLSFAPGFAYTDSAGTIKPKSWQAYFISVNSNTVRFNTGAFNSDEPLIIQVDRGHNVSQTYPAIGNLDWSTYYGGTNGKDLGAFRAITHDNSGNVYAVGWTTSNHFPIQAEKYNSVVQGQYKEDTDAVVVKFNGNTDSVVWSTYYGGSGVDIGRGIALDASNNVFITGSTNSADFPLQTNSRAYFYQPKGLNGTDSGRNTDAFVAMIVSAGYEALWSTWYGGPYNESGQAITINSSTDDIYVVGDGGPKDSLVNNPGGYHDTSGSGLILRFSYNNYAGDYLLVWATRIGNPGIDSTGFNACALDGSGNLYVAGASGTGYPMVNGFNFIGGGYDAVITKFNSSDAMVWSGYYGGQGKDLANGVTTDASGNVFMTGHSYSPMLEPGGLAPFWAYRQDTNGSWHSHVIKGNAFVAEFAPGNIQLIDWSTFLGGEGDMDGAAITTDANNNVYVTGGVLSNDSSFVWPPAGNPAGAYFQNAPPDGPYESFIAAFNVGEGYYWGTYLCASSSNTSAGYGITAFGAQKLYVVGTTSIPTYQLVNPGGKAWFQPSLGSASSSAFISEFNLIGIPTGMNKIESTSGEVKVYPNPTNENVTVQLKVEQTGDVEFTLYNLLGEPVNSEIANEPTGIINKQISLSSLPNGNYILQVIAGSNVYHQKITKLQ